MEGQGAACLEDRHSLSGLCVSVAVLVSVALRLHRTTASPPSGWLVATSDGTVTLRVANRDAGCSITYTLPSCLTHRSSFPFQ